MVETERRWAFLWDSARIFWIKSVYAPYFSVIYSFTFRLRKCFKCMCSFRILRYIDLGCSITFVSSSKFLTVLSQPLRGQTWFQHGFFEYWLPFVPRGWRGCSTSTSASHGCRHSGKFPSSNPQSDTSAVCNWLPSNFRRANTLQGPGKAGSKRLSLPCLGITCYGWNATRPIGWLRKPKL